MCSQFHRFPSGRNPLLSILCNLLGFVFVFVRHSSNHSLVLSEQSRFCRDLNDVTLVETSLLGVGVSCWQNMQDRLKLWQMAKVVEIFLQLPKYQNCWQPVGLRAESARGVTGRRCSQYFFVPSGPLEKIGFFGYFEPNNCLSGPFWWYARPKYNRNEVPSWFSDKCVPKLLLPLEK